MRRLLLGLLLAASSVAIPPMLAQAQTAAPVVEAVTAAEVLALIDAAKAEQKDGKFLYTRRALQLAPYATSVEYRAGGAAPASLHEVQAEMLYVIEGSATLVTGGTIVDRVAAGPGNWSGTSIADGASRPIAKGDWVIVPQNTPHQFIPTANGSVVLMTIKIPRS